MNCRRIASVVALVASVGCAYHTPAEPSAPAVDLSSPTQLTLGTLVGTGVQAGTATLTARVQNARGSALANVAVTFTTSLGDIAPSRVTTGVDGLATARLSATDTAQVTASAGTLSARSLVAIQPPSVVTIPTPTPSPTPTPTPSPTPVPAVFLNVSSSATTGVPLTFSVSSSAPNAIWSWDFGDGTNAQTTAFAASHTYAKAGVYVATVSSPGVSSANATITVTDPAPAGTTPGASLSVTISCTPLVHGAATTCTLAVTDSKGNVVTGQVGNNVTWDFGDGNAPQTGQGTVKSNTYNAAGSYTVGVTVTANGLTGTATKTLTIT